MKKARSVIGLFLAAALMAVALCGCGGDKPEETPPATENTDSGSAKEPVIGGEITVGIAQDIDDSLDPQNMTAAGTREILFNVYEGLMKPDSDGNLIPAVAEAYTISESGDTFTFTLREGVLFHNGEPVQSGDVVYSISRAAGLSGGEAIVPAMQVIESVEASEDGKTITIKTSEPNIEILSYLTTAIIPEGTGVGDEIIGTGPYKLVSRTPQEEVVMERFEDYWGDRPYLDRVTFKVIEDADALVTSLKSGAVDLCAHLTASQAASLSEFTVLEGTMNLVQALYLNNAEAPFDQELVRQALCYAVNPQEIMDFIADGRGTAVGSSMYPAFTKYFLPELAESYPYNVELAKEMLAEAGYPDGFDMTITVPSNYQPHVDTAQVLVQQLAAVGVNAKIELVEWASWLTDVYQNREFQSTVVGVDAATMTASAMLERFRSDSETNFINFSDEEYDRILDEAMSCVDEAEQTELYKELQTILSERAANVYIQDLCDMVAMRPDLEGYEFYPIYVMDLSKIYLTE